MTSQDDPPKKRKKDLREGNCCTCYFSITKSYVAELRDAIVRAIEPVREMFDQDIEKTCEQLYTNGYDVSMVKHLSDEEVKTYGLKAGLIKRLKMEGCLLRF